MEDRDEFRRHMKIAGEQWNRPAGRHLSDEEVYAYCRGEAPPEAVPALREHLTQCPACLELYRDAADFLEIRQSEEAVAPEVEGEWRALRSRLPQLAATAPAAPKPGWSGFPWLFRPSFGAALAAAALVAAVGVLVYLLSRQSKPAPVDVAAASPTPAASATTVAASSPEPGMSLPPLLVDELIVMEIRGGASDPEEDQIRSEGQEAVAALQAGQRLYVDVKGASSSGAPFARSIQRRLKEAGRFVLTEDRETAQVALKLTVREAAPGASPRRDVSASIVNAKSKVLWPREPHLSERRYIGPEEKVLDRLVRDLLADVQP